MLIAIKITFLNIYISVKISNWTEIPYAKIILLISNVAGCGFYAIAIITKADYVKEFQRFTCVCVCM